MSNTTTERALAYRDALAEGLSATALWRQGKAEEYPDDERNLTSAAALTRAAGEVKVLPLDHAFFRNVGELDELLGSWGKARMEHSWFYSLGRAAARFGFDRLPGGIRVPYDLDRLLDDIFLEQLEVLRDGIVQGINQPPKALVGYFDEWGVPLWDDEDGDER